MPLNPYDFNTKLHITDLPNLPNKVQLGESYEAFNSNSNQD